MIYLFGGTSLMGWTLLKVGRLEPIIPFCNSFTKLPATHHWPRLNLEDRDVYQKIFSKEIPPILIHCGGVCDVDQCEKNPEWAYKINVVGIEHLMTFLPKSVRLLYVSTDHVFGGRIKPYTEGSTPTPLTIYGQTRVFAEQMVLKRPNSLIVRVGLPLGPSLDGKTGHLDWLKVRTQQNLPMTIVMDEYRSAFWAQDGAKRILELAHSSLTGIRHLTTYGAISRVDLVESLKEKFNINAMYSVQSRHQKSIPHLGHVELGTLYKDPLATPLPRVVKQKLEVVYA